MRFIIRGECGWFEYSVGEVNVANFRHTAPSPSNIVSAKQKRNKYDRERRKEERA